MHRNYPINLGLELAFYIWRQAHDKRSKNLFCGSYITQLLIGMGLFQDPGADAPCCLSKPVSDGPFPRWKLKKLFGTPSTQMNSPSSSEPDATPSTRPSQFHIQCRDTRLDKIEKTQAAMKKDLQSIKRKNSKFRKFVGQAFQSLTQCFKPGQVSMPTYISSEEEDDEPTDPNGKRPSMAHCKEQEEEE